MIYRKIVDVLGCFVVRSDDASVSDLLIFGHGDCQREDDYDGYGCFIGLCGQTI